MQNPTEHSGREILERIKAELERNSIDVTATPFLQFRLVFLSREGSRVQKHITFTSPIHRVFGNAES